MQHFDLVLVAEYFRTVPYFTSIIRHLSKEFRIAVFPVPVDPRTAGKNDKAQAEFLRLCQELGAVIAGPDQISASLVIVPQRPYTAEAVALLKSNIRSRNIVGALAFAWAGMPAQDRFIEEFGIRKVYAIDMAFLTYLLRERQNATTYENVEIAEVGLPYEKYPVFEDFSADYMLAMPTPFSFPHEEDKWLFMETVLDLFKKIPPNETIVHKPHNGLDRDQFTSKGLNWLTWVLAPLMPLLPRLKRFISPVPPKAGFRRFMGRLYTAYLYENVLRRARPLYQTTRFHQLGLEVFLPFIKRGVIGGLSNTMWGSLYFKKPFYNCVDITVQNRGDKNRLYGKKDPGAFLDTNLRYFALPYCRGMLEFDEANFDKIPETCRKSDLIKHIAADIRSTPAGPEPR
ncbi:MAG: hypothetical protein RIQ81_1557 [Pseudomonadota bacterium]